MRRDLFKLAVVSKQDCSDRHTGQKHGDDHQPDLIPCGPGAIPPQLFVQKFLVTVVHLGSALRTVREWVGFLVVLQGTTNPVHQSGEAAVKIGIEFYAVRTRAIITRQLIKLVFQ